MGVKNVNKRLRDENTDITTYQERRGVSAMHRQKNQVNTSVGNPGNGNYGLGFPKKKN